MYRPASNEYHQAAFNSKQFPRLFKPEAFLCQCGKLPSVEISHHPQSGKAGYSVVRCTCGNESIYAKESYKSILDWNSKTISQDGGVLGCPGLKLEEMNLHDALDAVVEEGDCLKMLIADKDRPNLDAEHWRLLKARVGWCQMLVPVIKRRLKLLNAQPKNL